VTTPATGADELKRQAAIRAADWIQDGMRVGLGTGSTIRFLLDEVAERLASGRLRDIIAVPTSEATAERSRELGIRLVTLEESGGLDVTIDGADEVDPEMRLIKGLGGALLREKIVAASSSRLVIIVDGSKMVQALGSRAPLPVEVDPFGCRIHEEFFRELGSTPELRRAADGSAFLTDGGHHIYDCRFPDGIRDPERVERRLQERPGIIESGLFLGMADHVVVARPGGTEVIHRDGED
jgi:ribose 5-phosphate isomerase A